MVPSSCFRLCFQVMIRLAHPAIRDRGGRDAAGPAAGAKALVHVLPAGFEAARTVRGLDDRGAQVSVGRADKLASLDPKAAERQLASLQEGVSCHLLRTPAWRKVDVVIQPGPIVLLLELSDMIGRVIDFHDRRLPLSISGRGGLRSVARITFLLTFAFLLLAALLPAQSPSQRGAPPAPTFEHQANPYTGDPERIREGRRIYNSTCVICHGVGGAGGRGPNLRESRLNGLPFLRVVWEGRQGTQMPPWKGKLSEEEVWKIMAYLGR
jgi:mono/diheme cytochrome c family protein